MIKLIIVKVDGNIKKGFTLIELLAVIIILAVIALIATPIVMDVIADSKESGNRSSVAMYADAIELQVTTDWFKRESYPSVNKTWVDTNVEYSGNRVTCEEVYYDTTNGVLLHRCTVGNEVSMLDNIKVYAEDKVYCYYKKEIYEDCEENAAYMANYNSVKSGIPVVSLPVIEEDTSEANEPELFDNMIPVIYDETKASWIYADKTQNWYSYSAKKWANAVVLNSGIHKNIGDIINVDTDVNSMFVWIPRYKYTIFNGNNGGVPEQEVNVIFEKNDEVTGTVKCHNYIKSSDTRSESCSDTTNNGIQNGMSTYTHPAFCFGEKNDDGSCNGTKLTGFWIGKFKNSISDDACNNSLSIDNCNKISQIHSLPNKKYWVYATLSNYFLSSLNYKTTNAINADSHMIKNMEWDAVAFLKQSKYGLSTTNMKMNSYYDKTTYETMSGCGPQDGNDNTYATICNAYDTNIGMTASTAGNIYGVYDMSSIISEYVIGVGAYPTVSTFPQYSSNFNTGTNPEIKYYDMYTNNDSSKTHGRSKLGDATKENVVFFGNTSRGWYGVNMYMCKTSWDGFIEEVLIEKLRESLALVIMMEELLIILLHV